MSATDWRRGPQATRRLIPEHEVETLRGRWFAAGCLATSVLFAIGYYVLPLIGGTLP